MSSWRECKLGEVAFFQRGHDLPKTQMNDGLIPVAGSNGIIGFHDKSTTKAPGITIGRSGNIGIPKFYNQEFWAHNTVLYVKDFKGNDEKFVFYLLNTIDLSGFNSGSAVPTLNRNHIHEIDMRVPPLEGQKAIAEVLSSLDDKIDLLHRQNQTLESLAQTLFRQWFIEEAKEEWEVGKLGDILSTIESGIRPKGGIDPELKNGFASIGAESINGIGNFNFKNTKYITEEFFSSLKRGIVDTYDVLIYKDGAYIGKKAMFGNGFPFDKFAINEHVFILRSNEKSNQFFLYFLLEQDELATLNANSAQPGLNQEAMKSFQILIPPYELIEKFGIVAKNIVDKILFNSKQIQTLENLRDTLLPKLLSGEVRI
jgi:type I restriction enzyme S subunit